MTRVPRRWALGVGAVLVVQAVRLAVVTPPLSGGTLAAGAVVVGAGWLVWATGRPVRAGGGLP